MTPAPGVIFGRTVLCHPYHTHSWCGISPGVEKEILNEIIHFSYLTYLASPSWGTPATGGHGIYDFSLSGLCPGVEKEILKDSVCLWFIVLLRNFSLIWRRNQYRWRVASFDLWSAFMAIEQWGFFTVPHLRWHRTSVYDNHLRGSMTLTPIAERLELELSVPLVTNQACRGWDSNTHTCTETSAPGVMKFTIFVDPSIIFIIINIVYLKHAPELRRIFF